MALAQRLPHISETEYLRLERESETRSEYFQGEVFAMAGGSPEHSVIATNIAREVSAALKASKCVTYNADLRVKVEKTGLLTYPDLSVVCGEPKFLPEDRHTLLNPTVLVEVVSESTEAYDRGKTFEHYRQISSLQEYLLVSQTEPRIEQFIRQPNGDWTLREASGVKAELRLPSLEIVLKLSEVFAKVTFPPSPLRTAR